MITWNINYNDKKEKVSLVINKLLGLGMVFIEGKMVYKTFSLLKNNKVKFKFNNKEYFLDIKEENLIYSGTLTLNEKETFQSEVKRKEEKKTTWIGLILSIPTIAIPIISIESTIMWFVGVMASFFIVKTTKSDKKLFSKIIIILLLIVVAWLAYYIYYLRYSQANFSNPGFIKWKHPMF